MKRADFLKQAVLLTGIGKTLFSMGTPALTAKTFKIRLLRNATLVIETTAGSLLVDPMLSKKDAMDPVKNAGNDIRIPMVELPITDNELQQLIQQTDAILVTHTHRDHWDVAAQQLIPKDKKIFCQPQDEQKIKDQGFTDVQAISDNAEWKGIRMHRTNGQHGTGEMGKLMAPVSGYVLEYKEEKLYIAGDTIFCDDVDQAIKNYKPQTIVVNAGGAQFLTGGPIVMNAADVIKTANLAKDAIIIAVHMEAINHCFLKRPQLKEAVEKAGLTSVHIPADGEWI